MNSSAHYGGCGTEGESPRKDKKKKSQWYQSCSRNAGEVLVSKSKKKSKIVVHRCARNWKQRRTVTGRAPVTNPSCEKSAC